MNTTIRNLQKAIKGRVDARRIYNATKHLDPHLIRDIGLRQDHMRERAYPI